MTVRGDGFRERTILGIKKEHPSWRAPKIRDKLVRQYPIVPLTAVRTN